MNLLPYSAIDALRQETRVRFFALVSIAAGIALLCVALVLFSLSLYVQGKSRSSELLLRSAQASFETVETTRAGLASFNTTVQEVDALMRSRLYPTDIVSAIALHLPDDISITSLSVKRSSAQGKNSAGNDIQVFVSGFAKTRDSLLSFRDALQSSLLFSDIVFPPASWSRPDDITFSFTATALQ
ncbi:MAG: hypothetical protein HYU05_00530 [Candidatus Wildermuthbacteria bacterium]|nr:hypothetical protein [Candidatus Wildermuthbacteria bacterium]